MSLRVALFYHSLVSDWNHGNAHFLRGIVSELQARGHEVRVFEPGNAWSRENLLQDGGSGALERFHEAFPHLRSTAYRTDDLRIDEWLEGVQLALVHEWNEPELIEAIGQYRARNPQLRIFFHDTHHRAITAPHEMSRFNLENFDGVLAYGGSLKGAYERSGWGRQVYVWHEAADIRTFYPRVSDRSEGDLVWIGNWGDEERSEELREFLMEPVKADGIKAAVYGVRYPGQALDALADAKISYRGWLPNFEVPAVFARFRVTVHVPRRPYTRQLPGIPTIRPFEALACGIPLVSAPWNDSEGLFRAGEDFLMVPDGQAMARTLRDVLNDPKLADSLRTNGLQTIRARHTCGHRVDELLQIYNSMKPFSPDPLNTSPRAEVVV